MPFYIAELGTDVKKYYIISAAMSDRVRGFAARVNRHDVFFFHPNPMDNAIPAYNFIVALRKVYPHEIIIHGSIVASYADYKKIKADVTHYIHYTNP